MLRSRFAALLVILAPLGACAVVQEKTLGESFDDASASSQIKSRLLGSSASSFSEVDVEVTGRLALLTGRVAKQDDRIEAERIAWSVRTIDEVANEIVVIDESNLLSNVNDEWITARIRTRLISDAEIKSVNYNIETFNGVVYLLGLAQSEEELRAAAGHAANVKGVQRVVSYVKMRDRAEPVFNPSTPAPTDPYSQPDSAPEAPEYRDPYGDAYGTDTESYGAEDGEVLDEWDTYEELAGGD